MTFKAYTTAVMNKLTYISFYKGRVRTAVRTGGHFLQLCCKFTEVSVCQKYENIMSFDKVIAKIIRVQFFCVTVYYKNVNYF